MARILIVEDDLTLLNALKIKLQNEGYEVVTAADGEEALEQIKKKPDAVCLDILLPKKSGMEVLEEIQNYPDLKSIPIIIISNSGQPVEIERAKALGVKDFLVKMDFTPKDVIDKLAPWVGSGQKVAEPSALPISGTETPTPVATANSGKTVLVVEDDKFLKKLMTDKLRRDGFNVLEAGDGGEALTIINKTMPAIILLDLMMPGVDGFQALQEIRANPATKSIPVIVLSNLGEKESIDRAMFLGANDYMIKAHFVLDEIVTKISALIK